jgi:glycine cleavage system regulatory protein
MTMKYGVMTTAARDREGLVAKYTDSLRNWGANLCVGYGQQLGRMFAFDALFQVDDADMNRIATGIKEDWRDTAAALVEVPEPTCYRNPAAHHYLLRHISEDNVGIVSKLTEVLVTQGASIVDLQSFTYSASDSGVTLFEVCMQVDVPNSIAVRNLREEFSELERYRGWEIHFTPTPREGARISPSAPYPLDRQSLVTPPVPLAVEAAGRQPAEPMKWAVLSTISTDRPGILASNTRFLGQRRASIYSQAARRIGNQFSSHCLFKANSADMDRVKREHRSELKDFRPTFIDATPPSPTGDDLRLDLTVHAMDQPGILANVTAPITAHGASITAVSFGLYPSRELPHGTPLFVAELSLLVRDYIASRHIEAELLDLERNRGWEIDYRPAKRQPLDKSKQVEDD